MNKQKAVEYDLIVIGAGPAGSTAAILASRFGWRVMLLDQQRFPRRKVCGGCVSAAGSRRLQLLLPGHPLPGVPQRCLTFITSGGRKLTYRSDGQGRIVSREELDLALMQSAAREGAIVRQGLRGVPCRLPGRWGVQTRDGMYSTQVVMLAAGLNGARELTDHQSINTVSSTPAPNAFGAMMGWQWIQPEAPAGLEIGDVEMHWLHGGYVGLARLNSGVCNVAVAVDSLVLEAGVSSMRASGPFAKTLERLQQLNPTACLWSRLEMSPNKPDQTAPSQTFKGVAGFPVRPTTLADHNLLRIGDSAGYAEPFTGDGMNLAMLSAELAIRACTYIDVFGGRHPMGDELGRRYARLMARYHLPRMQRTRWVGALLRQSWVSRVDRMLTHGRSTLLLSQFLGWVHAGRASDRVYPEMVTCQQNHRQTASN